jgi:hypothetical protein
LVATPVVAEALPLFMWERLVLLAALKITWDKTPILQLEEEAELDGYLAATAAQAVTILGVSLVA